MSFFAPHTRELLKHTGTTFLVVFVMSILAGGLDVLQRLGAGYGFSSWLLVGVEYMAKATFTLDAILFLGTTGMFAAHFLREYYYHLFGR